jgi:hypothetical protein
MEGAIEEFNSAMNKPTPDEIEAVIAELVAPCSPDDSDAPDTPLWWVHAYDPAGNERGIGTDVTLARARAAAWIMSHGDITDRLLCGPSLTMRDFDCVPRRVPDDWTFEIDDMPTQGAA